MKWNWQQPDWPNFTWTVKDGQQKEFTFQRQAGVIIGSTDGLRGDERNNLIVDLISSEAIKTSEIEGEVLNRESVQSSIRYHLGLGIKDRRVPPAEQGIANMLTDLYLNFDKPLSHKMLHSWHRMVVNGRTDLSDVGRYRTHSDPMQVVSGEWSNPKVHYEAPPSKDVEGEMHKFLYWYSKTKPDGEKPLPPLVRAAIAHHYFVCIHPYEDGNGRIGRAIAEKALAESLGRPSLTSLSLTIERNRRNYHTAIERSHRSNNITPWVNYFTGTAIEAQQRSLDLIRFILEKAKLYERAGDKVNERQKQVIDRMFREGLDGFKGGLSAENYVKITKASASTATRDLQDMVEMGLLNKTGTRASTRYWLNIESPKYKASNNRAPKRKLGI